MTPNISFIFHIQDIRPNGKQKTQFAPDGRWTPPDQWNAYDPKPIPYGVAPTPLYRWDNGRVSLLENFAKANELHSHPSCPHIYRCATVFTQQTSSHHFVGVPFDARRANVRETSPGKWVDIGFDHDEQEESGHKVYSYLGLSAEYPTLATNGWTTYATNLFPGPYIPDAGSAPYNSSQNGGLTGCLPLILAMVAFSCQRSGQALHTVLTQCIGNKKWTKHNAPPGRIPERGVVVTIWLDPKYGTSREKLDGLEIGKYGPIFAP